MKRAFLLLFPCTLCALLVSLDITLGQAIAIQLKSFGKPSISGAASQAPLVFGADGAIYGTTTAGGISGKGTVFRVNPDGTGYAVLHSFDTTGGDGQTPYAGLFQATNAALYGTTFSGGSNGFGTVFRINTNGSGYLVLHHFLILEGYNPYAGVIQGADGALYGTTVMGGTNFGGTVFKLNLDGSAYTVLRNLAPTNGINPYAGLMQGTDGMLYGAAYHGGTNGNGTLFKLNPDGSGFSVFQNLTSASQGSSPYATLIQGRDGLLYGSTTTGGSAGHGTIFKVTTNGTNFAVLHPFDNLVGAMNPRASLLQGIDGALYGTTSGIVFRLNTNGSGYSVLHSFAGGAGDGRSLYAALVQRSDGTLYTTTSAGGAVDQGTIFKIGTNGLGFTILFTFNNSGGDGATVFAGTLLGSDAMLYGTTGGGGSNAAGTVFKLATNGSGYSILHHFGSTSDDGQSPYTGLLQGRDGLLYGVTANGGLYGAGTIYKLSTNGSGYSVLYSFMTNGVDGQEPYGVLFQGTDGLLYGTTFQGGANGAGSIFRLATDGSAYTDFSIIGHPFGGLVQAADDWLYGTTDPGSGGTVFKLNTNGSGFTTLHAFSAIGQDGLRPSGRLLIGVDSLLYGMTQQGGAAGFGTVFKLDLDGSGYTRLYSFGAFSGDGRYPYSSLIQAGDGALYGLTFEGGAAGRGTVFTINTDGSAYAVLYSFAGAPDGFRPWTGPLAQGSDGSLYGTTSQGGVMDFGTVFRLLVPPRFTQLTRLPDRNYRLSLTGLGAHPVQIQASINLAT